MAGSSSWLSHERYPRVLLALLALFVAAMGIAPHDRADWLLENALLALGVGVLVATHRALPLSRISYTLIFLFLCLHTVGSHYTYSLVPYEALSQRLGFSIDEFFGFTRNQFDRAIHFAYGLLLAYPVREVFLRVVDVKGFWGYFLPLDLTMSTSMIYELIEWAYAAYFGGEAGAAYLGTQGDVWDAQKDMALATVGGILAMTLTAAINWSSQRDFAREWAESLRVKGRAPLGEDLLAQRLRD